jgi:hypothetical protein
MPRCPYCNDELREKTLPSGEVRYRCTNIRCPARTDHHYTLLKLQKLARALSMEPTGRYRKLVTANPSIQESIMADIPLRQAIEILVKTHNMAKRGNLEEVKLRDPEKALKPSKAMPGALSQIRYFGQRGFNAQHPEGITISKAKRLEKKGELLATHEITESPEESERHGRGGGTVFKKRGRMVLHRHFETWQHAKRFKKLGKLNVLPRLRKPKSQVELIDNLAEQVDKKVESNLEKDKELLGELARQVHKKVEKKLKKEAKVES